MVLNEDFVEIYKTHFTALVGLPAAAFFSTFLILLLKVVEKEPLEFDMLGIKFKGTSGQVVLWVFVFLSFGTFVEIFFKPYVNIKITKERVTAAQKAELIKGATELLQKVLNKNPQTTVVIIDEVETDNWGIGGESVTSRRQRNR